MPSCCNCRANIHYVPYELHMWILWMFYVLSVLIISFHLSVFLPPQCASSCSDVTVTSAPKWSIDSRVTIIYKVISGILVTSMSSIDAICLLTLCHARFKRLQLHNQYQNSTYTCIKKNLTVKGTVQPKK